jgi:RimJ/RimL family protein N-acetyltransferase
MENQFIVGKTVYLRPVESKDSLVYAQCTNNPEVRLTFFTIFPINLVRQEEQIRELYKQKDFIPFTIVVKKTDKPIGITAFHRVDLASRAAVYSIVISDPGEWGKGYGSEVTQLMVEYGFSVLNLNRIQLHVVAYNTRGLKAYEKAGFRKEGLLRQAMYQNDRYYDFYVMAILREEFYSKNRPRKQKRRK